MVDDKGSVGSGRSPSPPTDRVVDVVELLVLRGGPRAAAEVADELGLSRSTVASILGALDDRGWVDRMPDRSYRPGPRLAAVAGAAGRAVPVPDGLDEALAGLAEQVGCGAALGSIASTELTFVAVAQGRGRLPAGISVGTRLPLHAPVGAAGIAFADDGRQRAWLASAPPDQRHDLALVLDQVRTTGVAVWGIGAADPGAFDVLAEVVAHLRADQGTQGGGAGQVGGGLQDRVLSLLAGIGGRPYRAADLVDDAELPVSYLVAPVFDAGGRAAWVLHIGPLRAAVPRGERERYADALARTARDLDMGPGAVGPNSRTTRKRTTNNRLDKEKKGKGAHQ